MLNPLKFHSQCSMIPTSLRLSFSLSSSSLKLPFTYYHILFIQFLLSLMYFIHSYCLCCSLCRNLETERSFCEYLFYLPNPFLVQNILEIAQLQQYILFDVRKLILYLPLYAICQTYMACVVLQYSVFVDYYYLYLFIHAFHCGDF